MLCCCSQPYTLDMLGEKLKVMYKAMTDGKFGEALRLVNVILAMVPLTTVESRKEVDDLKEVISIARCECSPGYTCQLCDIAPATAYQWCTALGNTLSALSICWEAEGAMMSLIYGTGHSWWRCSPVPSAMINV